MANEPDVVRIKLEKRARALEPVPSGMTRRRFLTFLGAGSAALAAGSAGAPVGGAGDTPVIGTVSKARAAQASRLPFTPIEPTGEDDVVLPQGFKYDVIRKWGDDVAGDDAPYGYNNDFVAYFPLDALDYENNPIFSDNDFASQADVLVLAFEAAALSEGEEPENRVGTPLDRCEDIEVASDGTVYAALTNNEMHGNFYGQILKITEEGNNPEAEEFTFEVFAAGGPQSGFASPDNLAFDPDGNLWIITDISSGKLNKGIYESFQNNGAFVLPAGGGRDVYQFASGPVESELTGPFFTPDGSTLFLAVQHPGEETKDTNDPTSTWPDGDIPRPAVIAITGFA